MRIYENLGDPLPDGRGSERWCAVGSNRSFVPVCVTFIAACAYYKSTEWRFKDAERPCRNKT
jgi:hypothetical protein